MILSTKTINLKKITIEKLGYSYVITTIENYKAKISCCIIKRYDTLAEALEEETRVTKATLWTEL